MGTWFTGSRDSAVIFSPITSNVNFVDTNMFLQFQNNSHDINFKKATACLLCMYEQLNNMSKSFFLILIHMYML